MALYRFYGTEKGNGMCDCKICKRTSWATPTCQAALNTCENIGLQCDNRGLLQWGDSAPISRTLPSSWKFRLNAQHQERHGQAGHSGRMHLQVRHALHRQVMRSQDLQVRITCVVSMCRITLLSSDDLVIQTLSFQPIMRSEIWVAPAISKLWRYNYHSSNAIRSNSTSQRNGPRPHHTTRKWGLCPEQVSLHVLDIWAKARDLPVCIANGNPKCSQPLVFWCNTNSTWIKAQTDYSMDQNSAYDGGNMRSTRWQSGQAYSLERVSNNALWRCWGANWPMGQRVAGWWCPYFLFYAHYQGIRCRKGVWFHAGSISCFLGLAEAVLHVWWYINRPN